MVTGFDGMLMQIEQIRSLGMDSSIGTGVGISESMVDMLVLFRLLFLSLSPARIFQYYIFREQISPYLLLLLCNI